MADRIVIDIGVQGDGEVRIRKMTDAVKQLGDEGSSSLSRFSNVFDIFAGNLAANAVGKAFSIAGDAAGKFFDVLVVDGVKAAQETEDNITRLNQALITSGKYSKTASDNLVAYSESLQRSTKFSNDQVLQTEALISTFGRLGEKEIKQATKAALDLSAAFGIGLEQATRMVGKAAAGEADAFGKLRIRFVEGASAAENLQNALAAVNARVGGAAEAQVNTFSGALAVANHAFEDMTKEIGNVIIKNPALIALLKSAAVSFDTMGAAVLKNKDVLGQWVSGAVLVSVKSLQELINVLAKVEGVVAGEFGKKVFGPLAQQLEVMSANTKKFYDEAVAGAAKAVPASKQVVDQYKEISKAQEDLIRKGVELAEKSDPTLKYIKEIQALQAANAAKKVDDEQYFATIVELQAKRDEAISNSAFKEAEGYIEKNRALLADDRAVNDAMIAGNLDKLKRLAADERLSAKDRGKIQQEITNTEKKQYDERLGAGVAALSALASFQQFKSKEMQVIGKAAAIANTTIATYEGATKAYASLAGIPFVGPALAAAAAGAIIAAGLANVAKISGVDLETGLKEVPSGYPNDSFRANLTSGESVLNRRDNRMLTVAAQQEGLAQGMAQIVDRLDRLESHTTVIVGQKVIVDEVRDAFESGRVIHA